MSKRMVSVGDLVVDLVLDVKLPVTVDHHQMSPTVLFEPGGAATAGGLTSRDNSDLLTSGPPVAQCLQQNCCLYR